MFKNFFLKTKNIFLFIFLACFVFLYWFSYNTNKIALKNEELNRQYLIIKNLNKIYENGLFKEIDEYLRYSEYIEIDNKYYIDIISNGVAFYDDDKCNCLSGYEYDDNFFILVKNDEQSSYKLYKSNHNFDKVSFILKFLLIAVFIVICFYSYLISKDSQQILKLSKHIAKWSKGETKSPFKYNTNSEINSLVKEFNRASERIDELILSRQFFLRAIMHELKTPIGKGMIITDLPYSEKNNNILKQIFERLSVLTNEFGKIEQVLSKNHILNLQEYSFLILFEQVKDIMFLEDESIINIEYLNDENIFVDAELFTLLLKNLLDNALKYSKDGKCHLSFDKNEITIKNSGDKLEYDIKEYFKPFIRGSSTKPGLGLGLYLIKYICDIHNFTIDYSYESEFHIFRVKL